MLSNSSWLFYGKLKPELFTEICMIFLLPFPFKITFFRSLWNALNVMNENVDFNYDSSFYSIQFKRTMCCTTNSLRELLLYPNSCISRGFDRWFAHLSVALCSNLDSISIRTKCCADFAFHRPVASLLFAIAVCHSKFVVFDNSFFALNSIWFVVVVPFHSEHIFWDHSCGFEITTELLPAKKVCDCISSLYQIHKHWGILFCLHKKAKSAACKSY